MQWTEDLRTGVDVIDEQHQGIFSWFNELKQATDERRTLFAAYVVTRLGQYVREHFAIEETLLREKGYPRFEEHVAEHEAFRSQLRELKMKAISDAMVSEMVEMLREWLTRHILESDKDYARFIRAKDGARGRRSAKSATDSAPSREG